MFKDDYCKELDNISASEKFKTDTISLMYAKQHETAKTVKFAKNKYAMIAASIAIMLMVTGVHFMAKSDYFITADNAVEEFSQLSESKQADTDGLSVSEKNLADMPVYTIADATSIEPVSENKRLKTKLYFDGRSNGGMGFEGYLFYSPSQLEQNKTYSTSDKFDNLPVYQCITLSDNEKVKYIDQYIQQLGLKYTELTYNWCKPVYKDGHYYTDETVDTTVAQSPGDGYTLFSVHGELSDNNDITGELWRWTASGTIGIMIDDTFTESEDIQDVANAAFKKHPSVLNSDSMDIRSWYDYNFYGDMTYDLYAYEKSDDYGENLFNSSINNISFTQYKHYEEDTQPTRSSFHFTLPAYNKISDLPAIDYRQALGLLYDGQFYSSYSDKISPDADVAHIEIVYRSPDYDMATKTKTGYALPFYKFYVSLDDSYNRETPDGTLHTYAAYYVCAIHPEYVQLDESYFHFN